MKRSALSFITVIVFCVTAFAQTQPRKFYEYEIVESTRPGVEVFPAPSINDYGDVAFSARLTPGGGTVFLNVMGQQNVDLLPNSPSSHFVGGRVQINNSRQIIHQTFISGTKPAQTFIRRINGGVGDYTIVAYANGAGSFNDFDQLYPSAIGINNDGEPVYTGVVNNMGTNLITGVRPNFSILNFPSSGDSLNPSISDCGAIAVRAGANPTDPIRLYDFELDSFEDIATTADGFTSLGRSPAVSDLCDVVTFYGDLSAAGAEALGTNPGPGIFASIEINSETFERRIVRLAGRLIEDISAEGGNDDGYCDPGETCMQGELGFRQDGTPIFFSSFDTLNRVAVIHQSVGEPGIEDDVFVVSFLGTPNTASDKPTRPFSNQLGLWTVNTQIKNVDGALREKPNVPVPVIQVADVVDGKTVNAINVYDQLASVLTANGDESPASHRLAFHLATNSGNVIVRAKRTVEVPVVFIPGVGGSVLAECNDENCSSFTERWPANLFPSNYTHLSLAPGQQTNIQALGPLKSVLGKTYYQELLAAMTGAGGLTEYEVENKPKLRTLTGCDDDNQAAAQPNFFPFAYDWRKSNSENAEKLHEYVQCIQQFYPGTKVDIVAHSMGGLLARRYILDYPQDHNVRKLVTIASPFLGGPKSLKVLEDGSFFGSWLSFLTAAPGLGTSANSRFKQLVPYFPGAHELLPSEKYFSLGGKPFAERFDFNHNGVVDTDGYDYAEIRSTFNQRFATMPYETNHTFHEGAQDDWQSDSSGVQYYQLFGKQDEEKTPEQVIARKRLLLSGTSRTAAKFTVKKGFGDGTVPVLSAQRIGNGQDLNAPSPSQTPQVFEPRHDLAETDANVEHNGLTKNARVQQRIFEILGISAQSVVGSASHQGKEENMSSSPSGSRESNFLTIEGDVERLRIADDLGRTNTPINEYFEEAIPNVSYEADYLDGDPSGFYSHDLGLTTEREYMIKFRTGNGAINGYTIELIRGAGNFSPSYAVRYLDLELPPDVECLLTVTGEGMEDLRYDSNGDGTYDTVVPAHVRVSGAAAQDVTAPAVTFAKDMATGLISVNAADSESGVGTIYYRYAGDASFQIYTAPFVPTANSFEAFADDNVGNRSSPVTASLVSISGRVMDSSGRAVSGAFVTLTDPQGGSSTFRTNTFGYYSFDAVLTGHT